MDLVPEPTPLTLLERLRDPGEKAAWDRFVQIYTPLLFYWVRATGLQAQDAADLVQDVFVTLVQQMPSFRYDRQKSFRAWLRTVMLNKWRDRVRARKTETVDPHDYPLSEIAVDDPTEFLVETEYRRSLTRRALELMQTDFRPETWRACWMTVGEGRPAHEVAATLNMSVNAVYAATCRVLGRLRQELAGLLD